MDYYELQEELRELRKEVKRQSYYIDMMEIQQLMGRYIYALEKNGMSDIWDDLFVHDDPRVRLEIMDSGAYIGPEHVKRALYSMCGRATPDGKYISQEEADLKKLERARSAPALLLMLTISTPCIIVDKDGQHAWGQWHLFGPHTNRVFDAESGGKKDTAFWIAGKYDNEFVKVNGEWKFLKLHPICWLRTPYDKSWLECADCRRTPMPYWPPDEPPRVSSFNPDEGMNPDKWGPFLPDVVDYRAD